MQRFMWVVMAVALLSACDGRKEQDNTQARQTPEQIKAEQATVALRPMYNEPTAASEPVAFQWQGRWTGPEGTFLVIQHDTIAGYSVTIANLDGVREYPGRALKDGLAFRRGDTIETLRAGNGRDTGMKWLADKKTCLVIKAGEGYCRD